MKSKLTIVLTIKGRQEFTLRWMSYMNSLHCEYKILIADGGSDAAMEKYLENKKNYPNLHYDYFKYPFDEKITDYYLKLCDITDKVTSPYILYADNDDFYLLDCIKEYILFLDANSDYVCCGGGDATLSVYSKSNQILNSSHGNFLSIRFDKCDSFAIESESTVDRICDFFKYVESNKLWFIWYGVQRTDVVKTTHKYLRQHEYRDPVTMEIYKILSLLVFGKYKKFKSLFYIRQAGSSEASGAFDLEANVMERFIDTNAFCEILDGLVYLNKSIAEKRILLLKAFTRWFAQKGVILYFSPKRKIWLVIDKLSLISKNFVVMNFVIRGLYFLRNLISSHKVYFLKLKLIERFILIGN